MQKSSDMEVMAEEKEVNDGSDPAEHVKVVLRNRTLIAMIVAFFVAAATIVSFIVPDIYEAKAVIAPIESQTGAQAGMSAVAASLGIAPTSSSNVNEMVNTLKSNILREKVIRRYNLLPVLFKPEELKRKSEDRNIWNGIRLIDKKMKINYKLKEGVVEISMQCQDPKLAADILNDTLTELTDHMSSEAKRVADTNRKYLESLINDTADPIIKSRIYGMIAQQIERSMMAGAKENFAFKLIDPPKVPDKRISPRRTLMVTLSFVMSLFWGIFVAFLKEYWQKNEILKRLREEKKA